MIRALAYGITVVCLAGGIAGTAIADPAAKARAKALHAEAVADHKANCTTRSCPGFVANGAKMRQAMKLDPHASHALAFCLMFSEAKSAEKLGAALYHEAMMMCDVAATTHPKEDRRDSARSYGYELRSDAWSGTRGPRPSDPAKAARALYGDGFKVDRTAGNVRFAFGEVTIDGLQAFIRDWYIPMIRNKKYNAFALLNAQTKLELCLDIVGKIEDRAEATTVRQFCEYHAALEANATMHVFRGSTEITLDSRSRRLYGVQLLPKRLLYDPLVSVAGSDPIDDYASVSAQQRMLRTILDADKFGGKPHAYRPQALAIAARLDKLVAAKTKVIAAAVAKLEAKGPRVVMMEHHPRGWDPPVAAAGHLERCEAPVVRAYARGAGYVELALKVDGVACGTTLGTGTTALDPTGRGGCRDRLHAPGKHELVAELFATTTRKTGRKQVDLHSSSIDVKDVVDFKRARRLARGVLTCGQ